MPTIQQRRLLHNEWNWTADDRSLIDGVFLSSARDKFEIHSYRGAATILAHNHPEQFAEIVGILEMFAINTTMIRLPGGSKGQVAKYAESLFSGTGWKETRITADLHVALLKSQGNEILRKIHPGRLPGRTPH